VAVDGEHIVRHKLAVDEALFLIVVLADLVQQVFETACKTASGFEGCANVFDGQCFFGVRTGDVGSFVGE
jgi:hypothetical protein